MARALVGARVGDERTVRLPAGEKSWEVVEIRYPKVTNVTGAEGPPT
jgi:transcription elongation factor GreB